ncbi:MAG: acyl-CoA thioesterase [Mariprofundaceae bacterium]
MNQYGFMHGGRLLTISDETGFLAAHKHTGTDCLTVAVHHVRFYRPLQQKETLLFEAQVGLTGNTSLWVPVRVLTQDHRQPAMEAVIVFVAVNESRCPQKVSGVVAESTAEQQLQSRVRALFEQVRKKTGSNNLPEICR